MTGGKDLVKKLGRLGWLVFGVLWLGCDRRTEPYIPPEQEPPPPSRPVRIPGLEQPVPQGRQLALAASGGSIHGTVRLAPGVQAPDTGVLFIIARAQGGGPPLAVKRLPVGPFPLTFQVGPADVMLKGRPFEGPIKLSARIDRDGDPLTREPDNLVAESAAALEPGARGAELVLQPLRR